MFLYFPVGSEHFKDYLFTAAYTVPDRLTHSDLDPCLIHPILDRLLDELLHEQNCAAMLGSGKRQPEGAYTAAAEYCEEHQNQIKIPIDNKPDTGVQLDLNYLTSGMELLECKHRNSGKFSTHLNRQFGFELLKHNPFADFYKKPSRGYKSAMFTHLGRPVYESPFLANTLSKNAKLGVGGDFSKFWVVLRPIVFESIKTREFGTAIRVSQGMDTGIIQTPYDKDKSGPLFYITGSNN